MARTMKTVDGNEAAASIAYRVNEICAIYPITPSSTMGELADQWASEGRKNIWGTVPHVVEMQSEGGAAGAVHGALQTGAMTTTFTASQGLLLMIPNMFKIAGELTPTVFHVAARSLAAQALSIFGDHSDVMAARMTGWAMLCSSSVQEAHDLALIAENATLASRIPFVHFFDGFRTSHEISKIEVLDDDDVRAMIDDDLVFAHRERALNPDRPVVRGVAQNPDVYFQGRETVNPYYDVLPGHVQTAMDRFAALTGRQYKLFDYFGVGESGPRARADGLRRGDGARDDRTPQRPRRQARPRAGAPVPAVLGRRSARCHSADGQVDCRARSHEGARRPGRAALSGCRHRLRRGRRHRRPRRSCPASSAAATACRRRSSRRRWCKAVYDNLAAPSPKNHFTVGINDDVSHTSLVYDRAFVTEGEDVVGCVFYGLGADGTVGANKNSIKIIGEETAGYAQGFFVYDSKKSGSKTVSHLRFGPRPIRSTYLVQRARFVACHQFQFVEQVEMLREATDGGGVPAQQPVRSRPGLGRAAAPHAGGPDPQADPPLRHRRRRGCGGRRHGGPHQHHHADLLLRDLRRAAARRGDPEDQGVHRGDLRKERPSARRAELRGRGPDARVTPRGRVAGGADQHPPAAAGRAARRRPSSSSRSPP